jgi:hypothetical protein
VLIVAARGLDRGDGEQVVVKALEWLHRAGQ